MSDEGKPKFYAFSGHCHNCQKTITDYKHYTRDTYCRTLAKCVCGWDMEMPTHIASRYELVASGGATFSKTPSPVAIFDGSAAYPDSRPTKPVANVICVDHFVDWSAYANHPDTCPSAGSSDLCSRARQFVRHAARRIMMATNGRLKQADMRLICNPKMADKLSWEFSKEYAAGGGLLNGRMATVMGMDLVVANGMKMVTDQEFAFPDGKLTVAAIGSQSSIVFDQYEVSIDNILADDKKDDPTEVSNDASPPGWPFGYLMGYPVAGWSNCGQTPCESAACDDEKKKDDSGPVEVKQESWRDRPPLL